MYSLGMLEIEQPQHSDICLDVKSNPLCPYMSTLHKLACPICDTVVVNSPVLSIIILGWPSTERANKC